MIKLIDVTIGYENKVIVEGLNWLFTDKKISIIKGPNGSHPRLISQNKIQKAIEDSGKKVLDIHVWKIGPANHACQIVVSGGEKKGTDYYRKLLPNNIGLIHLVVEERN
jgi:Co/Zn/Cd efflux system component